jgi:hypothetical protein
MPTVWSSDKFDRKLAALFEEFEGREAELQGRLNTVIKALLAGKLQKAQTYNTSDEVVPLIDDYVIVFSAARSVNEGLDYIDISETDHFDLLNIERSHEQQPK